MGSLIGKFLVDEWFKMFALLGFVMLLLSLTVKLQIDNLLVTLMGATFLFIGVAEMAMRPYQEALKLDAMGQPIYKVSGRMRKRTAPGIILYGIAIILFTVTMYRLIKII